MMMMVAIIHGPKGGWGGDFPGRVFLLGGCLWVLLWHHLVNCTCGYRKAIQRWPAAKFNLAMRKKLATIS